jgi:hypothetical protein
MSVPETTVHKNYLAAAGKYQIGSPRKVSVVKAVAITDGVERTTELELRFSVF